MESTTESYGVLSLKNHKPMDFARLGVPQEIVDAAGSHAFTSDVLLAWLCHKLDKTCAEMARLADAMERKAGT